MEFWGIEVKPGETVKCDPGVDKYLHLSQASLGEAKKDKGNENIPLFVKYDNKKLVIGTLSADKCAQISYDLVFEKEFKLSHNWKNGSVFFVGYKTIISEEGPDDLLDFDSGEDGDILLSQKANGKPEAKDDEVMTKAMTPKADYLAAKLKVKAEELKKANEEEEDDDDDSDEDESDDEELLDAGNESSDEDEDSDESSEEEDEATPKKDEHSKKRAAGSASKTPAPQKKAKFVSPVGGQKTGRADSKKGEHTATPYPAKKQSGKTPATNDKAKPQTPISAGSVSCKSCSKSFNSDNALQAHTKAKHSGK